MKSLNLFKKALFLQILIPVFLVYVTEPRSLASEPFSSPKKKMVRRQAPSSEQGSTAKGKYMAFFSLGLLPGSMDIIPTTPISLEMSHGLFSNGIFIGGGMAVENFQPAFLPVFADLRFFLNTNKKIQPWIKMILGKNFLFPETSGSSNVERKNKGKIVTGVGAGLSYPVNSHNAFYFFLGYRYMKYNEEYKDYLQNPVVNEYKFNRMEFRIGLSF